MPSGIWASSASGNLTLDQKGFVHSDTNGSAVSLVTGGAGNVTADIKGDISGIDGGLIVTLASGYADIDVKNTIAGDSNDGGFGDAINVASRIEGINKEMGTRILLSEATFEGLRGRLRTRRIDAVELRGRQQKLVLYELVGR